MKRFWSLFSWTVANGVYTIGIYFWLYEGNDMAGKAVVAYFWFMTILAALILFSDADEKKPRPSFAVPKELDGTIETLLALVLAAYGHPWLCAGTFLQVVSFYNMRIKYERLDHV